MKSFYSLGIFLLLVSCAQQTQDDLDDEVGLMLYTIRDQMKDNPKEKLQRVATIGYDYIESAGYENGTYYGMIPSDFKQFMDDIDLEPMSSHHGSMTYENADKEIADAVAAGFDFVVIPVPPMGMFTYDFETRSMGMKGSPEELVGFLNTVGKKAKNAGVDLLYHNHDFEFRPIDGVVPYEVLISETEPGLVDFELDFYWVREAGRDIRDVLATSPGRVTMSHIKDRNVAGHMVDVGDGTIDFAGILADPVAASIRHCFVEHDAPEDPFRSVAASHFVLKAILE